MVIYLGLGSNLGDREGHIREAVAALRHGCVHVVRSASLYSTEPREFLDQPWFLNTVAEVRTDLRPHELLGLCLAIERDAGRIRDRSKGPRPIDIDILFYGSETVNTPELVLPHPRFAERRFVLAPLAEIAPQFQELLERCTDPGIVTRAAPPLSLL